MKRPSRRCQTGRGLRPMVRERIRTGLRFNAEVQVIDGFDGGGSVIVARRMRDDIDDERLAPLGGGASERRHR
jgi:hypothetical protein